MKKLLFVAGFLIANYLSIGQTTYPVPGQTLGTTQTMTKIGGGLTVIDGIVIVNFADTFAANLHPYVKNYAYNLISVNNVLWQRNAAKTAWVRIGGTTGAGSGSVTSVGSGLGLGGGPITDFGTLFLDTASPSVISRQRAAATYLRLIDTMPMLDPYKTAYPRQAISVSGPWLSYNPATGIITNTPSGIGPFTQYAIPFGNATGGLTEFYDKLNFYSAGVGQDDVLRVGEAGFSKNSTLLLNGGNGQMNASGWGITFTAQGGGVTDPSKTVNFQNNNVRWLQMYTNTNDGLNMGIQTDWVFHPSVHGTVELGKANLRWKKVYTDSLDVSGGTPGQVLTKSAWGSAVWMPTAMGPIPNLQQVTNVGNITTLPIIVNSTIKIWRGPLNNQWNLGIGEGALGSESGGAGGNTGLGSGALFGNTTGSSNTAGGLSSMYYSLTGGGNTAYGTWAMLGSYLGITGRYNTSLGAYSMDSLQNGEENTGTGYFALLNLRSGIQNSAYGVSSQRYNIDGGQNSSYGRYSLWSNQHGSRNSIFGMQAGYSTLGDGNAFFGNQAGYNELGSNKLYIHNDASANPLIWGDFAVRQLKFNGAVSIIDGTQAAGSIFTSDAAGNGSWQPPSGGQTEVFYWDFQTSTTAGDPGVGNFRFNQVNSSAVTEIYVDDITDLAGIDVSNMFTKITGTWSIFIQESNNASNWAQYETGVPYIDNTGWWTIPVTHIQHGGLPFAANRRHSFLFINENGASTGGGVYTATNGLNKVGNDIRLGGPLTATTTVTTSGYDLLFPNSNARVVLNNSAAVRDLIDNLKFSALNPGNISIRKGATGAVAYIAATNIGVDRNLELPNADGTLAVSVNGVFANAAGNITIATGGGGVAGISKLGIPAYGLTRPNDSTYNVDSSVITTRTRLANELNLLKNTAFDDSTWIVNDTVFAHRETDGDIKLDTLRTNIVYIEIPCGQHGKFSPKKDTIYVPWCDIAGGGMANYPWRDTTGGIYYPGGNVGIGILQPSSRLHTNGTVRHQGLSPASDTTLYKPLGIDANGNLRSFLFWAGSGSGSFDDSTWVVNDTVFAHRETDGDIKLDTLRTNIVYMELPCGEHGRFSPKKDTIYVPWCSGSGGGGGGDVFKAANDQKFTGYNKFMYAGLDSAKISIFSSSATIRNSLISFKRNDLTELVSFDMNDAAGFGDGIFYMKYKGNDYANLNTAGFNVSAPFQSETSASFNPQNGTTDVVKISGRFGGHTADLLQLNMNNAFAGGDAFAVNGAGVVRVPQYGHGAMPGTAVYGLGVTASGAIVETGLGSGSGGGTSSSFEIDHQPLVDGSQAFSHSIGAGYLSQNESFIGMAGRYATANLENYAVSSTALRYAYTEFSFHKKGITALPVLFGAPEFNNIRQPYLTAEIQEYIKAGYRAAAALQWLDKIEFIWTGTSSAQNTHVTFSNPSNWGGFASVPLLEDFSSRTIWYRNNDPLQYNVNAGTNGLTTANETLTYTGLMGTSVVIGTWGTDGSTNNWSRFTVTVDGVNKGTYTPNGKAPIWMPADGRTTAGVINDAFVVTGLNDTLHTIVLQFLDGGRKTAIDYIGTLMPAKASYSAPFYKLDVFHMGPAGYAYSGAPSTQAVMDSATLVTNQTLAANFPGYRVINVKTNRYYDPTTTPGDADVDGIHPNLQGQRKITEAIKDSMSSKSFYPKLTASGSSAPADIFTDNTAGTITKYIGSGKLANSTIAETGGITFVNQPFIGNNYLGVLKNGSDDIGVGPYFILRNGPGTSGVIHQMNASGGLDWWSLQGGGTVWDNHMTLKNTGQLRLWKYGVNTFAGTAVHGLGVDASGNVVETAVGGGSGSPAGSNTQLQYNNSGAFGASANLTFNGSLLGVGGLGIQSLGVNSSMFADNLEYNGGWKYRANGSASLIYFGDGAISYNFAPTNSGGAGVTATVAPTMSMTSSGLIRFDKYGVNTFAATPTYALGVASNGNLVEFPVPTGGGSGASPAGPIYSLQVNNGTGGFGADGGFTYDGLQAKVFGSGGKRTFLVGDLGIQSFNESNNLLGSNMELDGNAGVWKTPKAGYGNMIFFNNGNVSFMTAGAATTTDNQAIGPITNFQINNNGMLIGTRYGLGTFDSTSSVVKALGVTARGNIVEMNVGGGSGGGDAYLANNQTFTGQNNFKSPSLDSAKVSIFSSDYSTRNTLLSFKKHDLTELLSFDIDDDASFGDGAFAIKYKGGDYAILNSSAFNITAPLSSAFSADFNPLNGTTDVVKITGRFGGHTADLLQVNRNDAFAGGDAFAVRGDGHIRAPQYGAGSITSGVLPPPFLLAVTGTGDVVEVTNPGASVLGTPVPSDVSITPTGVIFHVTGTTAISRLNGVNLKPGTITLIFDDNVVVRDVNNLQLNGMLRARPGTTLVGAWDGTMFYETSRSIN